MRKGGKLACISLAVTVVSGLLGLAYLISSGVKEITSAGSVGLDRMLPAFYLILAVMFVSTVVMVIALSKRK